MADEKIVISGSSSPQIRVVGGSGNVISINDTKVGYIKNQSAGFGVINQQSPDKTKIVSGVQAKVVVGTQGPSGPQGPAGVSFDEMLLTKAEQWDNVDDSPSPGYITKYYGVADPQTSTSSAAWLITRTIFTPDGEVIDGGKTFASPNYDQVWDDHLTLTYT